MAGTTTYYGISYPTNTDYVKDGATAMQTIATGFDSAVAIPTYNNQTGTSYTFVLADAGKTVTSDNASAVTFTIPPQASVAWANNTTLTVRNLGAGVVTIAGGAGVTVTNTAQTVAQYGEVKLIRTASNAWTVVPASGGASGLTLLNTTTFTTSSGVIVDGVFSSTYDNYLLMFEPSAASGTNTGLQIIFRTGGADTTTNYASQRIIQASTTVSGNAFTVGLFGAIDSGNAHFVTATVQIKSPFLSTRTKFTSHSIYVASTGQDYQILYSGYQNSTTSFNGIKVLAESGTISGTLRIYGYQN